MKHLGDITRINGAEIEPVDVIIGGSPCQGMSLAGKREGLNDKRSGLYMEQIRVIKEMREHDRATGRSGWMVRPRFMVWENVPGAFSSNGGADFAAVIEEAVRIAEPEAPAVSVPEKGWPTAGCVYDEMGKWSIAWRVHDAQFWCVPQRRKRISLVCDFGGMCAPEILFERNGLHWNPEQSGEAWEGTAGDPANCVGAADREDGGMTDPFVPKTLKMRGGYLQQEITSQRRMSWCSSGTVAGTLDASYGNGPGMRSGKEREYIVSRKNDWPTDGK